MAGMTLNKVYYGLYRFGYEVILCLATWLVPKRKKIALFAPFYEDTSNGNLWPLYRYIKHNCPELQTVVVTSDDSFFKFLQDEGIKSVRSDSIDCFRTVARARFLLVDHNTGTVFWWGIYQVLANLKIIQLWHGSGFKKVVLLDEKARPKNLLYKLRYLDLYLRCKSYDCIISSSQADRLRKQECFQNKKVYITGEPKNDLLIGDKPFLSEVLLPEVGNHYRMIMYAPTFRDRGEISPFSDDFWSRIDMVMQNIGSVLLVKRHPQDQKLKIPAGYDRIREIALAGLNLQDALNKIDFLITDYSSIAIDFALTGKPMVFYLYDYSGYQKKSRSLYYELEEVLPGPFVYRQEELLFYLKDEKWFLEQEYRERYSRFKNRFHYYQDGGASQRIASKFLDCRGEE